MNETIPVLKFEDVTIAAGSDGAGGIRDVSFGLEAGTVGLVLLEEGHEQTLVAEAAQGLVDTDQGRVLFKGVPWTEMGVVEQSEQRGRIRRVFDHYGWISNLDVAENLCLAECHHSGRGHDDVLAEAKQWADRFGLPRIPEARPVRLPAQTLRKLEWVRAFLGRPELIILERPLLGVARTEAPLLADAVREAAERGVAVLWMACEAPAVDFGAAVRRRVYRMDGERLIAVTAEEKGKP